jgi:hypothetical protein
MEEIPVDEVNSTETWLQVLFVSGVLGGGAAWLAGRAIALTWRPLWHVIGYMALLAAALRFFHFALFEAEFLAPLSYLADMLWLTAIGSLSWRLTRTTQMVTQYYWLYRRTGPVTFAERGGGDAGRRDMP